MLETAQDVLNHVETSDLVIFDFDGTLVNLEGLNYSSLRKITIKYLGKDVDLNTYRNIAAGVPSAKGIEKVFKHQSAQYDIELDDYIYSDLSEEYRDWKRKSIYEEPYKYTELVPGGDIFINNLMRSGKHLAVCSASSREFIKYLLELYKLYDLFEFVVASQDVNLGKPNSEPYDKVVEHFNIDRDLITVFEDSKFGLMSGKAAGLFVVGILNQGWNDEFVYTLADVVIDDYRELLG